MRIRHILLVAIALGALTLSSCDMIEQWLGLNFTVSGTLTGSNFGFQSKGTVKVTNGSDTLSSTFTIPAPVAGSQSGSFSFQYVPKGTYTVTISAVSNNQVASATATLNGQSIPASGSGVGVPTNYTDTVTINNVTIDSNSTLAISVGGAS
jgi:hypothetical protein